MVRNIIRNNKINITMDSDNISIYFFKSKNLDSFKSIRI